MTGIGIAIACVGEDAGPPPPPPLYINSFLNTGDGPYYVSGASGKLDSLGAAFTGSSGGGTPPYTYDTQVLGDPSGKLDFALASDGLHNTIGWTGFAVSEAEGCYFQFTITDSTSATATCRYPARGVVVLQRTS